MNSMIYNGNTHPGKQRKENQDAYGCRLLWDQHKALLLVVDGVGGYAGGERAAAIAKSSIEKYMQTPKGDLLTMLKEAVIYANNQIADERKTNPQYFEMCCVLTAVVADAKEGILHFAHVGDTRLYRFRNGILQKLTRDHSFVGIREDAGEISEKEAMRHPQRNQILREAGSTIHRIDDEDWMDSGTRDFIYGDQLLLCSDGLTDMLTGNQISAILSADQSQKEKVGKLIALANEMGGYDNITVVLMQNKLNSVKATHTLNQPAVQPDKKTKADISLLPVFNKAMLKRMVFRSILLLLFIAGTGWYFFSLKPRLENGTFISSGGIAQTLPHQELKVRDSTKENLLFTVKSTNPAAPVPPAPLLTDTLVLATTQKLAVLQRMADSSGKILMLIPAKKNPPFAAAEISAATGSTDTIVIRNLYFRDFDKAIRINTPAAILLKNTTFENIRLPITYLKHTNTNKSLLITSNSD